MFYHSSEWFEASPIILGVSRAADDISIRIDLNWSMDRSLQVPSMLTLILKTCSDTEYMYERLKEGVGYDPDYEVFELEEQDGSIQFYGWWENGEATCEALEETFSEYTADDWTYKVMKLLSMHARAVAEQRLTERAYRELTDLIAKKAYRELDRGSRKIDFLTQTSSHKAATLQGEINVYETILGIVVDAQSRYRQSHDELYRSWQESPPKTSES